MTQSGIMNNTNACINKANISFPWFNWSAKYGLSWQILVYCTSPTHLLLVLLVFCHYEHYISQKMQHWMLHLSQYKSWQHCRAWNTKHSNFYAWRRYQWYIAFGSMGQYFMNYNRQHVANLAVWMFNNVLQQVSILALAVNKSRQQEQNLGWIITQFETLSQRNTILTFIN